MLFVSPCIFLAGSSFSPDGIGSGTTSTWPFVGSLGIGQPQPNYSASSGSVPILTAFLVANTPQIVASYIYLMLNNMFTSMLAMAEWTSYANGPGKGLRVSSLEKLGFQRGTYFLSVPFRWAIPCVVVFTTLHWLFSQMLFLARIEVYDMDGQISTSRSLTTEYFSPLAMLLAVSLTSAILLAFIGIGIFKRYPSGAPLAGCCSASISAACQPGRAQNAFDDDLPLQKLRWGVVYEPVMKGDVGHATFSSGIVQKLVKNRLYA
jgi:hypothetical protein